MPQPRSTLPALLCDFFVVLHSSNGCGNGDGASLHPCWHALKHGFYLGGYAKLVSHQLVWLRLSASVTLLVGDDERGAAVRTWEARVGLQRAVGGPAALVAVNGDAVHGIEYAVK